MQAEACNTVLADGFAGRSALLLACHKGLGKSQGIITCVPGWLLGMDVRVDSRVPACKPHAKLAPLARKMHLSVALHKVADEEQDAHDLALRHALHIATSHLRHKP